MLTSGRLFYFFHANMYVCSSTDCQLFMFSTCVSLTFLLTQVRSNVEALVGEFASGMSNLLGNMVRGWTAMTLPDGAEVAKHFRTFVPGGTSRPIGSRARYVYTDSQELPDSEEEFVNEGGSSDDDDDDYVGADDGPPGDAEMDNVHVDPVDEEPQQADVAAAVGKGKVPARASDRSTAGVEVSKRARDSEVVVADIPAKRSKLDPVAARKRFATCFLPLLCHSLLFLVSTCSIYFCLIVSYHTCSEVTAGGRVSKPADVGQPPRSSPRLKKAPRAKANPAREPSHTSTRSSPRFASCNTGDPVVLEDMRHGAPRYCYLSDLTLPKLISMQIFPYLWQI